MYYFYETLYNLLYLIKNYSWYLTYNTVDFLSYYYLIIFVILIILILIRFAYIYIKYPFWCRQPVFHIYDYWRYLYKNPFIIYKNVPMKTKFCDFINIKTYNYQEITDIQKDILVNLLQCYYISSEQVLMVITKNVIDLYFNGHNEPSFVSFYQEIPKVVGEEKLPIIGTIASRPFNIFYIHNNTYVYTNSYYLDFICVNRNFKTKNLGRNLIQTHEYNQRILNPNIQISFMKSEVELYEGIIPLVKYNTYTFYLRNLKLPRLPPHVTIIRIYQENKELITDFLQNISHPQTPLFGFCAIPDTGSIISMIQSNLLYVFCIRFEKKLLGYYFFKDANIQYEDIDGDTLQFVASYCNTKSQDLFYNGFLHSLRSILKEKKSFKMILFESISHNNIILNKWLEKHHIIFNNKSAYYLYNFIYPKSPINPTQCFFLV